jgi:mono/diheme cytochrome c family protein
MIEVESLRVAPVAKARGGIGTNRRIARSHRKEEGSPMHRAFRLRAAACVIAAGIGMVGVSRISVAADTAKVDFNKDIKPIIQESCIKCHKPDPKNPRSPAAGFNLSDKAAAMKGGKVGHDIVPGHADESLMYKLLKGPVPNGNHKIDPMPKAGRGQAFKPLSDAKIELIGKWIDQGAEWPDKK